MDAPQSRHYTLQEYFDLESSSPERWEYRDGEVLCMSGGSVQHSLITANVSREIGNRLKGSPCRVHSESLRVRIARRMLYCHPDVTVICGDAQLDSDDKNGETILNPTLVVEVLSPSTELYDRTKKFDRYLENDSFREYVLVSQFEPRVDTLYRHPDGAWRLMPTTGIDKSIHLASLRIDLPMSEIFAGVVFPPPAPDDTL